MKKLALYISVISLAFTMSACVNAEKRGPLVVSLGERTLKMLAEDYQPKEGESDRAGKLRASRLRAIESTLSTFNVYLENERKRSGDTDE